MKINPWLGVILILLAEVCGSTGCAFLGPALAAYGERGRGQTSRASRTYTIDALADDGSVLVFTDGSVWEIYELDRITTSLWMSLQKVTVVKSGSTDPTQKYLLVNQSNQKVTRAKYLGIK